MPIEEIIAIFDTVDFCVIGGGEPTEHPDFYRIIKEAKLRKFDTLNILVAGYNTEKTHFLLDEKLNGLEANIYISSDEFHPSIDPSIHARNSLFSYANLSKLVLLGRGAALKNQKLKYHKTDHCGCGVAYFWPDGKVTQCACPDSPVIGENFKCPDAWLLPHKCFRES